jgi:hypothetical protein
MMVQFTCYFSSQCTVLQKSFCFSRIPSPLIECEACTTLIPISCVRLLNAPHFSLLKRSSGGSKLISMLMSVDTDRERLSLSLLSIYCSNRSTVKKEVFSDDKRNCIISSFRVTQRVSPRERERVEMKLPNDGI